MGGFTIPRNIAEDIAMVTVPSGPCGRERWKGDGMVVILVDGKALDLPHAPCLLPEVLGCRIWGDLAHMPPQLRRYCHTFPSGDICH